MVNAGHNFPYLFVEGKAQKIKAIGNRLGFREKLQLSPVCGTLENGNMIVVYTDGLFENHGPDRRTLKTKLIRDLAKKELTPNLFIDHTLAMGKMVWKNEPAEDDIAIVAIQFLPNK